MAGEYIEFNNNSQPALNDTNINRLQQLIKQDIQGAISGDTLPIGAIMPFGSDTIPDNWLLCNGQAVSRTDYQELFNTIGTNFGSGDGFTTFNLPDLRERVPVGKDENDEDFDTLGETGGEKEHTLTINEMPTHNHVTEDYFEGSGGTSGVWAVRSLSNLEGYKHGVTNTGGNQPHNILQPYVVQNYIIKAKQSAGVVATVVDGLNSTSATNALSAKQGKVLNEKIQGTVLYSNETGTTGNVTLSDSVANYDYIEIQGKRDSNYYSSGKLYNINGKNVVLTTTFTASGLMYIYSKNIQINGNSITNISSDLAYFNGTNQNFDSDDRHFITRVVGYKIQD